MNIADCKKELRFNIHCLIGSGSHLNTLGKIVFFPLLVFLILFWLVLDLLFSSKSTLPDDWEQ